LSTKQLTLQYLQFPLTATALALQLQFVQNSDNEKFNLLANDNVSDIFKGKINNSNKNLDKTLNKIRAYK
jgi:hypothetical protein